MRVEINSNVLTVETDIPVAVVERGIADLTAYDEKKNPVYAIKVNPEGKGDISQFGLVANSFINNKLAVVIVAPLGADREYFIRKYGKGVVAANKFCPIIAGAAASEAEMLEAVFGPAEQGTEAE